MRWCILETPLASLGNVDILSQIDGCIARPNDALLMYSGEDFPPYVLRVGYFFENEAKEKFVTVRT